MTDECEFCGIAENCPNYYKGYAKAKEDVLKDIEFYFHKCWIGKKVPKLEEIKQSLNNNKEIIKDLMKGEKQK